MSASTTQPELIYFGAPGRASLTRLAFAAGGIEYKDTRVSGPDELKELKANTESLPATLSGSLPVLEHNGLKLAQSLALAQYASDLGLTSRLGTDPAEIARNRATDLFVAQTHEDMKSGLYGVYFSDAETKEAKSKALPAS